MASLGFTYYNTKPVVVPPTIIEMVASLSGEQKTAILDGFTNKIIAKTLYYKTGIDKKIIIALYKAIDEIEEASRELMRSETPPATSNDLLLAIRDQFSNYFNSTQITAILSQMVKYSKYDGSGNWTYYKSEVIK